MADIPLGPAKYNNGKIEGVRESLEGIESKIFIEKKMFDFPFKIEYLYNDMVNIIFGLSKLLYKIFSTVYSISAGANTEIDKFIKSVITVSATGFSKLYASFLPVMIVVLLLYSVYQMGKHRKNFFTTFFKGSALIFILGAVYSPSYGGESGVSLIYSGVNDFTGSVASQAITGLAVSSMGGTVSEPLTADEYEAGYSYSSAPTDDVLTTYFRRAIWYPYVAMNTDIDAETPATLTDDQLIALIDVRSGDMDATLGGVKISQVIGTQDEPRIKKLRQMGNKWEYALVSLFDSTLTGFLLAGIGLMTFVLRLVILVIFFVFPMVLIIGVLPMFRHVLESSLINIGKNLLFSQFINVGLVAIIAFDSTVMSIFSGLIDSYVYAFFAKWLSYYIAWKTRRIWLQALKPKDYSLTGRLLNRAQGFADKVKKPTLKKVASTAMTTALIANGARRLMKERRSAKKGAKIDSNYKFQLQQKYVRQGDDEELAGMKADYAVAKVELNRQEYAHARREKTKQMVNTKVQEFLRFKTGLSELKEKGKINIGFKDGYDDLEERRSSVSAMQNRIRARSRVMSIPNRDRLRELANGGSSAPKVKFNRQMTTWKPNLRTDVAKPVETVGMEPKQVKIPSKTPSIHKNRSLGQLSVSSPLALSEERLAKTNRQLTQRQTVTFASQRGIQKIQTKQLSFPRQTEKMSEGKQMVSRTRPDSSVRSSDISLKEIKKSKEQVFNGFSPITKNIEQQTEFRKGSINNEKDNENNFTGKLPLPSLANVKRR